MWDGAFGGRLYGCKANHRPASGWNYRSTSWTWDLWIYRNPASGKWCEYRYYYNTFWVPFYWPQLVKTWYSRPWWSHYDSAVRGLNRNGCDNDSSWWSRSYVSFPQYRYSWYHTRRYWRNWDGFSWRTGVWYRVCYADVKRYKSKVFLWPCSYFRPVPRYRRMAWKCTDIDWRGKSRDFHGNLLSRRYYDLSYQYGTW